MKGSIAAILLLLAQSAGAGGSATGTVRVAAIQCPSIMGRTEDNVRNLTNLVRQAAARGAIIIVTPECAVQGYLDPTTWTHWTTEASGGLPVRNVAEAVPGPSTALFARLAKELHVYLCIGLIEAAPTGFFNAQVLLGPDGSIVAHHRKKGLWTPGDSAWCTPGDLPIQVVKTEYGNLGLMICYDFHTLPPHLAKRGVDIVLYSVGWYGPNEANWFGKELPARVAVPNGLYIVAANWASATEAEAWPGRGHSAIITREGKVVAMSDKFCGNDIVIGDLPIGTGHHSILEASLRKSDTSQP